MLNRAKNSKQRKTIELRIKTSTYRKVGIKVQSETIMGIFVHGFRSRRNITSLGHGHGRHGLQKPNEFYVILTLFSTIPQRVSERYVGAAIDFKALRG